MHDFRNESEISNFVQRFKKNERCSLQYEKRSLVKKIIESFKSMAIAHRTDAPVVFSFIQMLVRTLNNQKPNRKAMILDRDLILTLNLISALILPSPSPSPSVIPMAGEQLSPE